MKLTIAGSGFFPARDSGLQKTSPLQILLHPSIHCLIPELAVDRLQHPVAFIREVEHLGGDLQSLERGEELKALGDIEPVIQLPVDDERGRLELRGKQVWRPLAVSLSIRPRRAAKLPLRE